MIKTDDIMVDNFLHKCIRRIKKRKITGHRNFQMKRCRREQGLTARPVSPSNTEGGNGWVMF
jgi:hypothetical protein